MLILPRPANQDRLNAAVVEVIGLNVMGPVGIPGDWDAHETIRYAESRAKASIVPYASEQGVGFFSSDKWVHFTPLRVTIQPVGDCEPRAPASSSRRQ